ncbi:MAG TPA: YetF domain-containing protein [Kofleriaceae bacterium]|nr:YetF domain-containing protein [Kofleriaceae bacterium]
MDWTFVPPATAIPQLLVRALLVYVFLVIGLRLAGRRETGQLTTFDLILLLILSNAVQNSLNAGDNSLGGGLVSALALLVLNWAVGWATYRWRWFERIIQGRPLRIVTDGKLHRRELARERITLEELRSALRKQGIESVSECQRAVLEADGTLTAVKKGVRIHTADELTYADEGTPT